MGIEGSGSSGIGFAAVTEVYTIHLPLFNFKSGTKNKFKTIIYGTFSASDGPQYGGASASIKFSDFTRV